MTDNDRQYQFWLACKGCGIRRAARQRLPIGAHRERQVSRKMTAKRKSASMMNMGAPARHKIAVPADERTVRLFKAHEKRQASGWVRG